MKTSFNRMGRIRLFSLLFQNGCSQSSRFLPQARRIVSSGDENGLTLKIIVIRLDPRNNSVSESYLKESCWELDWNYNIWRLFSFKDWSYYMSCWSRRSISSFSCVSVLQWQLQRKLEFCVIFSCASTLQKLRIVDFTRALWKYEIAVQHMIWR